VLEEFKNLGRDMFLTGLVSSHTGAMSMRVEDNALISRRAVMLGRLSADDLVEFGVDADIPDGAAEDAAVHQAIYRGTDAKAVVYARPPWTMALALVEDRLSPAGDEASETLGSAPVLISQRAIDSPDVANMIARTLRESRIVALRGHGVFARGDSLADAMHMVSLLEEMCKVVHIYRTLSREERQPTGPDHHDRQPTGAYRPRNDGYGRNSGGRSPVSGPGRRGDGPRPPLRGPRPPAGGRRGTPQR
jgi:L-fuculose-phosphate aldolase